MNEQIKELERQSVYYVPEDDNWEFDRKKFAELIIKECVKALWTEDCHVSDLAIIDFNEKKRKIFNHMGITE